VLFGGNAAKIVALGLKVRLIVKDRWMAGMGDEIRQVVALGQVASERSRGVKYHYRGTWLQCPRDRCSYLADCVIWNRQDHDFGAIKSFLGRDARQAKASLQVILAYRAALHVPDLKC
jgi:hypothetical protein